ncbi:MAG: helix-turn-helix domain-containing protein [Bacteroidales bacterium]|nr:helix-turn-helix domain-containing protein [Clostridium sp.]MCM1203791.1 helix-turn-helix domain-containing protein [Bacteroidales bacterium]
MQIGEVIHKYRKEKNITQEEMAKRLGVTAPAVNKWEKGVSQPDISLLAPIARLLNITLETLLSFHEQLSPLEITEIIEETDKKFDNAPYEEVFSHARQIINKYPNCFQLIWQLAVILNARLITANVENSENYDAQILEWYKQALTCEDKQIQKQAADSLFSYYMRKENYSEAEKYIPYFPEESTEYKQKLAQLYSKTDRKPEAYKAYEEILFSEYQVLNMVMYNLFALSVEDDCLGNARMWAKKASRMAELFDMGKYRMASCQLELAILEQNVQQTVDIAKTLLSSAATLCSFLQSGMYSHMKFKEPNPAFYEGLRDKLLQLFRDKETYSYMKDCAEWEELIR